MIIFTAEPMINILHFFEGVEQGGGEKTPKTSRTAGEMTQEN